MAYDRTAAWDDAFGYGATGRTGDQETLRHALWIKAKRFAADLPFAEDLLAAYYCAFDRDTPFYVKTALVGALAYLVLPFELPGAALLPILGLADEAAVLAGAFRLVGGNIQPVHREAARRALRRGLGPE